MMKTVCKKALSFSMALVLIFSLTALLSGCTIVNSGTMSEIEGTYELMSYTGPEDRNHIEEKGIKLLLVIKSGGVGYYAYQDNETPAYISEFKYELSESPNEPGKYSNIAMTFYEGGSSNSLSIDVRGKNLNGKSPVFGGDLFAGTFGIEYYVSSYLALVSKKTDLTTVKEHFPNAKFMPYGAKNFEGVYELEDTENSDFVYFITDINIVTEQARAWYMLKSDEKAVEIKGLKSVIAYDNEKGYYINLGNTVATMDNYCSQFTISHNGNAYVMRGAGLYDNEEIENYMSEKYDGYIASLDIPAKPETALEFWVGDNVDNVKFSNYQEKYGMFGGKMYYGTGYAPTVGENGEQIDPEHCVIYTVTSYPDYSDKAQHITGIHITDPAVSVYGVSVGTSLGEFERIMKGEGFIITSSNDTHCIARKGKMTVSFTQGSINISVKVLNKNQIEF